MKLGIATIAGTLGCAIALGVSFSSEDLPPLRGVKATESSPRLSFGEGGTIWLQLDSAWAIEKKGRRTFEVDVVNDGGIDFTFVPEDLWFAVTKSGSLVPLTSDAATPFVVPSLEAAVITLSTKAKIEGEVASLAYRSKGFRREVQVRCASNERKALKTIPVLRDPAVLATKAGESLDLFAVIGSEGTVERVISGPVAKDASIPAWQDDARKALEQWSYEPASQGGAEQRTLVRATFRFDSDSAVRAVFKSPPSEFIPRVHALLLESSYAVAELPSVGGLVATGFPAQSGNLRGAAAALVRAGTEPG